jgi:hypothetical protein
MSDFALIIDSVVVEGAADWSAADLRLHVERALQSTIADAGWLEPGREPTAAEARETLSSSLSHVLSNAVQSPGGNR